MNTVRCSDISGRQIRPLEDAVPEFGHSPNVTLTVSQMCERGMCTECEVLQWKLFVPFFPLSFILLCVLKQRLSLGDLAPVEKQSSPAIIDAASLCSFSVTFSMTVGMVAPMSRTASHVSTATANLSKQIKEVFKGR